MSAPPLVEFVRPGTRFFTDEAAVYSSHVRRVFHETVNHAQGEYVRGEVHTNNIEGFWANVKRSIAGTYVWVSKKHLQTYLREFEFRHNLRKSPHLMLDALLLAFRRA